MESKYYMLIVAITCSILILLNTYLLRLGIACDTFLAFWLPVLILGFLTIFTALTFNTKFPLVLILIFAFILHMIQFVRQPPNIVWNDDSIYVFQVVEHVLKTGRYDFGFGTGDAYSYSFYPLFHIFLSIFSSITSLSSMLVVKYSMSILNLATLLGFYAMLGLFKLDVKSKNLIACMFNLNPMFHYFNSYAHPESYAIIFYPLVLLYVLKLNESYRSKNGILVVLLLLITVSTSHHFTSYMTALALVIPMILLYGILNKTIIRTQLCFLALILPLTWLTFIASFLFTSHLGTFSKILSNLSLIHTMVGYTVSPFEPSYTHYPSVFAMQLTLLRNFVLVSLTFLGLLYYRRSILQKLYIKEGPYSYFGTLLLLNSALTFLSLFFVNWSQIGIAPRTRLVEFLYFPASIFSALGLTHISQLKKVIHKKGFQRKCIALILASALTIIFIPPTIFNAFQRYNYDSTYSPFICEEPDVAPETQYALSNWVLLHTNRFEKRVFAGSLSAERYVIGYGLQEKWAGEIFNINSIKEGTQKSWSEFVLYYIVNKWNFQFPDIFGQKMDKSITNFLDGNFSRVYDNGVVISYRQ